MPVTLSIIKTVLLGENNIDLNNKNCDCSRCQDILKKRVAIHSKKWMRPSFYFKCVLVLFFWFVWNLCADKISKI